MRGARRLLAAVSVPCAAFLAGCGSIYSIATDQKVYGGARFDVAAISIRASYPIVYVVDFPMSLVLDTALLPVTLPIAAVRYATEDDPPSRRAPDEER